MFTSKPDHDLAFVSRQLAHLLADHEVEPAFRKLSEASSPSYAPAIKQLRAVIATEEAPGSPRPAGPFNTFARLAPSVTGSKVTLFRDFVQYVQQSKVMYGTYWAGIVDLLSYLASLALVALVVAGIFGVYVVPAFSQLFASMGATLPALTETVFQFGGSGLPWLAIALVLIIALGAWFALKFRRRIRTLTPLPRILAALPVIGRLATTYNEGLFLNFLRLLRNSGVEQERAVSAAAAASNQPEDLSLATVPDKNRGADASPSLVELAIAARLGHFDDEIRHQCDDHVGRLSMTLVEARDRFAWLLKLLLYVFVGTLVVAMYLPIFKMGSVV